ncbi:MAG: transporter substrate-binding domain-containing protein [Candidatus Didemnitutus sp.]|nr:transporter substrate-binding domain-containing protein [Candidatus Didemnitutus sp.]
MEAGMGPVTGLDATGRPTGFGPALLVAVAKEMGFPIIFVVRPWSELLHDIRTGKVDVLSTMGYTPERDEFVDFTATVLELQPGSFARKEGDRPKDIADLHRFKLAVQKDSLFEAYLRAHGQRDNFVYRDTVGERLDAVAKGEADVAFVAFGLQNRDVSVVRENDRGNLVPLAMGFPGMSYRLYFGVREGDKARLGTLNEGLTRIRDNGVYAQVYESWIGPLKFRQVRLSDVWTYVVAVVLIGLTGLGIMIWQRRFMQRLARQTAALRDSEEKLKLVLEAGDHGYWDTEIATGWVERSDRAMTMLGYQPGELPSTVESWLANVHPDDLPVAINARMGAMAVGNRNYSFDHRLRTKAGEWRWIHVKGKVLELHPDGTAKRAAGTVTDITPRKIAEVEREEMREEMRTRVLEAQRLESVGLLAGGVAHDFNNLLTVIGGSTGLARLEIHDQAKVQYHLDQIEGASKRAADMCRQLLASAGRGNYTLEAVDLNAAITDTMQLIRASVPASAELELDLAPNLPPIEVDPSQIRQVIMNLVINAGEALSGAGGKVRLHTGLAHPTTQTGERAIVVTDHDERGGEQILFSVTDSGVGMSAETARRIFEPFFTTKFTGRGLGLAATLGLIRSFGGSLFLASTEGTGTSFRLFFPRSTRALAKGRAAPPARTEPAPVTAAHILVVDDEPAVLAVASAMLTRSGYRVTRARDGVEAIEKFVTAPESFDGVLLDLTMPDKDGAAVLQEIRVMRPDIPVLIMSGFGPAHVTSRLPKTNPPPIVRKPFTGEILLEAMARVLRRPN